MQKQVLITGGAGFIGSHLADELLARNYKVRVLDNLSSQVHGPDAGWPEYLSPEVERIHGDIADPDAVTRAVKNVDAVVHFAAAVGVGQSMYEFRHYTAVNNIGTAVLLETLLANPVERLIVASSMSIYGEGLYVAPDGTHVSNAHREVARMRVGEWEPRAAGGEALKPVPTPEEKSPSLASIYALSKYNQEVMCMVLSEAYKLPAVALRFFNVYGPRQALSNPYTGVLAIFASRLLNNNRPLVYEDGRQQRDFVSVYDVAQACRLALEVPDAAGKVFNVGSGSHYSVLQIADRIAQAVGKDHLQPEVTHRYRRGDIRHCFADISKAKRILGYAPRVDLDRGLCDIASWLEGQVAQDRVVQASAELEERGLTV